MDKKAKHMRVITHQTRNLLVYSSVLFKFYVREAVSTIQPKYYSSSSLAFKRFRKNLVVCWAYLKTLYNGESSHIRGKKFRYFN